jgi:DNA-binding MarR family transcriptional regulator
MINKDKNTRRIIATMSKIGILANRIIVQKLCEHGIEGLVPSHGDILVHLFAEKEMSMKNLAARINKKKNTVTALINKLIHSGYVKKSSDSNDHRVSLISLTEKAENLKKDFEEISDELISITYKEFSEKEKKEVMKYLDRIAENLMERKAQ